MVLLLGGFSCTGKTLTAHKTMTENNIPYFSIDYLKMSLFRADENCGFTPTDPDEHVASILWPYIREMIYTYVENKQDIIIEGAYIMPEYINELDKDYLEDIEALFMGFSKDYIQGKFESSILAYKGAIEDRDPEDERPMSLFIEGHLNLKKRAQENNLYFHEIKGDYLESIEELHEKIQSLF